MSRPSHLRPFAREVEIASVPHPLPPGLVAALVRTARSPSASRLRLALIGRPETDVRDVVRMVMTEGVFNGTTLSRVVEANDLLFLVEQAVERSGGWRGQLRAVADALSEGQVRTLLSAEDPSGSTKLFVTFSSDADRVERGVRAAVAAMPAMESGQRSCIGNLVGAQLLTAARKSGWRQWFETVESITEPSVLLMLAPHVSPHPRLARHVLANTDIASMRHHARLRQHLLMRAQAPDEDVPASEAPAWVRAVSAAGDVPWDALLTVMRSMSGDLDEAMSTALDAVR